MLVKKLKENNGTTFIETIIAMVILAIIVVPFMSAFVFTERGTVKAGEVLGATFTAQRKVEQLSLLDFRSAIIAGNGTRTIFNGAYIEALAVPHHPANPLFFNVIVQDTPGRNLVITTPTIGRAVSIEDMTGNTNITLQISANGYSVGIPGQSILTGSLPSGNVLIMLNATQYTKEHIVSLNIQPGARTVNTHVYTSFGNDQKIAVTGVPIERIQRLRGFTYRNFSKLRARVSVFENLTETTPTSVIEGIFELQN